MNHLENPLTPNQVMLLKKVVSKFKSKMKTPIEEESAEDRSPLLSSSLVCSPRSCLPQTLAIPSISPTPAVAQVYKQRATWGKFLRKTSEHMLGMQQTGHKVAADADDSTVSSSILITGVTRRPRGCETRRDTGDLNKKHCQFDF